MHVTKYVCKFMKTESTTCKQCKGQVCSSIRLVKVPIISLTFPAHKRQHSAFILLLAAGTT